MTGAGMVKVAVCGLAALSVTLSLVGLIYIPRVPDLYNLLYAGSRLSKPEGTVGFFVSIPMIQVVLAALFTASYPGPHPEGVRVAGGIFVIILSVAFTLTTAMRLSAALHHFHA